MPHKSALLIAVAFALVSSSLLAQTKPPLSRTEIKLLTPYGAAGLSMGMAVTAQVSGSCFAGSAASPSRPDAWRCHAGNAIQDPCFQNRMGDPKVLACARDPWSANVVLLTLTSALPTEPRKEMDSTLPWALELANGHRCTMFTGATAPIAGMRINYGCADGFIVVGDIDKTQPVWRVFARGEKSIALMQVDVTVAWY
jgi:hypothetical protein